MTEALRPNSSEAVLVVDDNDDDILLFRRACNEAGIQNPLHIVRNGDEAIAYLKRAEDPLPALVLLDLKMPGKSGFDVLRLLRAEPRTRELRVVVVTTSDEVHTVDRAYKSGANSFVVKSVGMNEFVEQLRDLKKHWL